jgi:hypothetical protein
MDYKVSLGTQSGNEVEAGLGCCKDPPWLDLLLGSADKG